MKSALLSHGKSFTAHQFLFDNYNYGKEQNKNATCACASRWQLHLWRGTSNGTVFKTLLWICSLRYRFITMSWRQAVWEDYIKGIQDKWMTSYFKLWTLGSVHLETCDCGKNINVIMIFSITVHKKWRHNAEGFICYSCFNPLYGNGLLFGRVSIYHYK